MPIPAPSLIRLCSALGSRRPISARVGGINPSAPAATLDNSSLHRSLNKYYSPVPPAHRAGLRLGTGDNKTAKVCSASRCSLNVQHNARHVVGTQYSFAE